MIYFAHPIDRAGRAEGSIDARVHIRTAAAAYKVNLYEPGHAFNIYAEGPEPAIADINLSAQEACEGLIAYLPAGVPTYGVPVEINRTLQYNQKCAVLTDIDIDRNYAMPQSDDRIRYFTPSHTGAYSAMAFLTGHGLSADSAAEELIANTARWAATKYGKIAQTESDRTAWAPSEQKYSAAELPMQMVSGTVQCPTRVHPDDAGLDLYVSEAAAVPPRSFVDIHCGIAVQLPAHTWGFLVGRSSTLRKRGLLVNPGIIDCGYRGELYAGVQNMTDEPVKVGVGERLAQLIILENSTRGLTPVWAKELTSHARGSNGFGSSGS